MSLLKIEVEEDSVTITIPDAKVLDKKVDPASITKASFIVDVDSADIKGEDQIKAYAIAQENMVKTASEDSVLLASAQQRAQSLLEDYVTNIGNAVGKEYSIVWKYLEPVEKGLINEAE